MVKKIQYTKMVSDRTVKIIIRGKIEGVKSIKSDYYKVLYCNFNQLTLQYSFKQVELVVLLTMGKCKRPHLWNKKIVAMFLQLKT